MKSILVALFGPITSFEEQILPDIKSAFILIVAGVAVFLLWKRQFVALVGFMCLAILSGMLVYAPGVMENLAQNFAPNLFKDWTGN
jgi:hypothetical protein